MRTSNGATTVIEEVEALQAAVTAFLDLYEPPGPVVLDPALDPTTFPTSGPCLAPLETLHHARLIADPDTVLEAAHQTVETQWGGWHQSDHPAIQDFVTTVEQPWLRTSPGADFPHQTFPARRGIVRGLIRGGLIGIAGTRGLVTSYGGRPSAVAIAQGGKAFGELDVETGDGLYGSRADEPPRMPERLLRFIEEDDPYPARLTSAYEAPRRSFGRYDRLETWRKAHHDTARLMRVDPLPKIRPLRRRNGDIYAKEGAR